MARASHVITRRHQGEQLQRCWEFPASGFYLGFCSFPLSVCSGSGTVPWLVVVLCLGTPVVMGGVCFCGIPLLVPVRVGISSIRNQGYSCHAVAEIRLGVSLRWQELDGVMNCSEMHVLHLKIKMPLPQLNPCTKTKKAPQNPNPTLKQLLAVLFLHLARSWGVTNTLSSDAAWLNASSSSGLPCCGVSGDGCACWSSASEIKHIFLDWD